MREIDIRISSIIRALEGRANNTDTDPRWMAAQELRKLDDWDCAYRFITVHTMESNQGE